MAFKMYGKSPMTKKLCGASAYKKVGTGDEKLKTPMMKRGCGCKPGACMCGKRK